MPRLKGIIIGAGIGGLAAAIALNQAGIPVEIYEQVEQLREVGAGISIWANAVKVLDRLGLQESLRVHAIPQIQGAIRNPEGTVLTSAPAGFEEKYGAPNVILHRAELQKALLSAAKDAPIHLGCAFTRFEQDSAGVTAWFADGSQAHADFLVGADGIHSQVRTQIHGAQKPRYAGYTSWRAVVPFDHALLTPGETWGAGARFGQVPMAEGLVYWFATKNTPPGKRSPRGEKAELLRLFSGWHAPIEDLIQAATDETILRNDILDRPVLSWWGMGRVSLLGDAAHPMTPNLGQGACQALEDALALAKNLHNTPQAIGGLRAYEAARIPRVNPIVERSRQVGWIGQWQNRFTLPLREFLLRYLISRLQNRQLDQVVGYEI